MISPVGSIVHSFTVPNLGFLRDIHVVSPQIILFAKRFTYRLDPGVAAISGSCWS